MCKDVVLYDVWYAEGTKELDRPLPVVGRVGDLAMTEGEFLEWRGGRGWVSVSEAVFDCHFPRPARVIS